MASASAGNRFSMQWKGLAMTTRTDTDSIGAMTGAIAGASHGASAIPRAWIDALEPPARRQARQLAAALSGAR